MQRDNREEANREGEGDGFWSPEREGCGATLKFGPQEEEAEGTSSSSSSSTLGAPLFGVPFFVGAPFWEVFGRALEPCGIILFSSRGEVIFAGLGHVSAQDGGCTS